MIISSLARSVGRGEFHRRSLNYETVSDCDWKETIVVVVVIAVVATKMRERLKEREGKIKRERERWRERERERVRNRVPRYVNKPVEKEREIVYQNVCV